MKRSRYVLVAVAALLVVGLAPGDAASDDSGWQTTTPGPDGLGAFRDGWASADAFVGSSPAAVKVQDDDVVRLRGTAIATDAPTGPLGGTYVSQVFQLPCDVRPPAGVVLATNATQIGSDGYPSVIHPVNLLIDESGIASLFVPGAAADTSGAEPVLSSLLVALDGLLFEQENPGGELSACDTGPARVIWVDPDGDDTGPGTETEPLPRSRGL